VLIVEARRLSSESTVAIPAPSPSDAKGARKTPNLATCEVELVGEYWTYEKIFYGLKRVNSLGENTHGKLCEIMFAESNTAIF